MTVRRVAVKIAYSGSDFSGSQVQPGLATVMGEVACALVLTGGGRDEEWFDLKCSSRTDVGVNALGNAVSFNTFFEDDRTLLKALNGASRTVHFISATEVPEDFNVRYADARLYRYVMPKKGMDVDRMRECASLFLGYHDFARFCKYDGKPTDMTMESITIGETEDAVVAEFESRYFLWNQIRRICAAIIAVGKGRSDMGEVRDALNGKAINFGIARADALTLVDVRYDGLEFKREDVETLRWKKERLLFANSLQRAFLNEI